MSPADAIWLQPVPPRCNQAGDPLPANAEPRTNRQFCIRARPGYRGTLWVGVACRRLPQNQRGLVGVGFNPPIYPRRPALRQFHPKPRVFPHPLQPRHNPRSGPRHQPNAFDMPASGDQSLYGIDIVSSRLRTIHPKHALKHPLFRALGRTSPSTAKGNTAGDPAR